MNTTLKFKRIVILISLSLAALLFSQGYWLKGLYDSTWIQVNNNIQDAMRIADYKEIFIRLDKLSDTNNPFHGQIKSELSFSDDKENVIKQSGVTDSLIIKANNSPLEKDNPSRTFDDFLNLLTTLEGEIQLALHQKIDSLMPIDYTSYDSLLTVELKKRNIFIPYKLEVVQKIDGFPKAYMSFGQNDTFETKDSWEDAAKLSYPIPTQPEQYYRLSLKTPSQLVLQQMAGILISSFLLVILILIAFIYLIHTILKQKTIEELKTDFTNNMTHELKTPISVAYAANDVLLNYDNVSNEKQKKYLTIVREQLMQLNGLVEQILTLSVENRSTFRLKQETIQISELLPPLIERQK